MNKDKLTWICNKCGEPCELSIKVGLQPIGAPSHCVHGFRDFLWEEVPKSKQEIEQLVYIVTAYRYGDKTGASYLVGIFFSKDKAIEVADSEEDFRGVKCSCGIIECPLNTDRSFCTFKSIREPRPTGNRIRRKRMSQFDSKNEIEVYERNNEELTLKTEIKLTVSNHWNRMDLVVLEIAGETITVSVDALKRAISNAQNAHG